MKKIILIGIMLTNSILSLRGMEVVTSYKFEHAPIQKYPAGIGYLPVEEVLTKVSSIPDDVKKDVDTFLKENPALTTYCAMPKNTSDLINQQNNQKNVSGNMSKNNIALFTSTKKTVIKIASIMGRIRNIASSQGLDPYQIKYDATTLPTIFSFEGPTMQHTTIPIAQYLLEKFNSDTVQASPTWFYHIPGNSTELDDRNYIIIQEAIPHNFRQFSQLSSEEKKEFCTNLDLGDFYAALKHIHYAFPSEDNLWVDTNNHTVKWPDTESPDNEGLNKAKYGKAILGQDLNKAKHNIRNPWDGGHRTFENILKTYSDETTVAEWNKLYNDDTSVH